MNRHFRHLASALEHQRNGRLDQAERIYRQVLLEDGANADALHLLGVVAHKLRDHKAAAQYIARAIQIRPSVSQFNCSLGNVLQDMGLPDKALLCYQAAISQKHDNIDAHVNAGNSLQSLGRHREAVAHYLVAIEADPSCAAAYNNLGNASVALSHIEDGIGLIQQAVRLKPDYAEARVNLASALNASERYEEAAASCRAAIRLNPRLAAAHAVLGAILLRLDRYEESASESEETLRLDPQREEAYCNLAAVRLHQRQFSAAEALARQALTLRPNYPEALNNLGQALMNQSRLSEAQCSVEQALRLRPGLAEAWCNLASIRRDLMDSEAAEACYREATRLRPSDAFAQVNHALVLLSLGRFEEGWEKYEWRWRRKDNPPPTFDSPAWDGSFLADRTILVRAEQGLGDTIQFVRYLPLLKQQGAEVILECQPRLVPLLQNFRGADLVLAVGDGRPAHDVYTYLMSLPHLFHTREESIPGDCSYIKPDPALARSWGQKLAQKPGLRVGLSWAGNPQHTSDKTRSFPFAELEPLLGVPGVSWVSLQRGEAAWQLACSTWAGSVMQVEDETTTMADTAAVIANLDLVISADTMVAHLCGALGTPVWLLLCAVADWRWMLGRADSPYYPAMRIFRQPEAGNWRVLMEQIRQALESVNLERMENRAT